MPGEDRQPNKLNSFVRGDSTADSDENFSHWLIWPTAAVASARLRSLPDKSL